MIHINHLTLTNGHAAKSERDQVGEHAIKTVGDWLLPIVNSGARHALPDGFEQYAAQAMEVDDALLMTVYGKAPQVGRRLPLASFGVAFRDSHAAKLWEVLTSPKNGPTPADLKQPEAPWVATHIHLTAQHDIDAIKWMSDFERSVAWAWITRQRPQLEIA